MQDYRYAFADESEMFSLLEPLGMTVSDEDGSMQTNSTNQWAIDNTLGFLPSATDPTAPPMWAMNLRLMDDSVDVSSLEPYLVNPSHPLRVWA